MGYVVFLIAIVAFGISIHCLWDLVNTHESHGKKTLISLLVLIVSTTVLSVMICSEKAVLSTCLNFLGMENPIEEAQREKTRSENIYNSFIAADEKIKSALDQIIVSSLMIYDMEDFSNNFSDAIDFDEDGALIIYEDNIIELGSMLDDMLIDVYDFDLWGPAIDIEDALYDLKNVIDSD